MENVNIINNKDSVELAFNGEMTIQQAQEIKVLLLDNIQRSQEITINLQELKQIDMAGLQLLIAAVKSAQADGKSLTITHGSLIDEVINSAALENYLGDR